MSLLNLLQLYIIVVLIFLVYVVALIQYAENHQILPQVEAPATPQGSPLSGVSSRPPSP